MADKETEQQFFTYLSILVDYYTTSSFFINNFVFIWENATCFFMRFYSFGMEPIPILYKTDLVTVKDKCFFLNIMQVRH